MRKEKKPNISQPWQLNKIPQEHEKNQESETVQGEAFTIHELYERIIQGFPTDQRETQYIDGEDFDALQSILAPSHDLTDISELKQRAQAVLEQVDAINARIEVEKDQEVKESPVEEPKKAQEKKPEED